MLCDFGALGLPGKVGRGVVKSVHPVSTCESPANTILVLGAQNPRVLPAGTAHSCLVLSARARTQKPTWVQVTTRDSREGWAQGRDWGVSRSSGPRVVSGNC